MNAVARKQQGIRFRIGEVVDRDDLDVVALAALASIAASAALTIGKLVAGGTTYSSAGTYGHSSASPTVALDDYFAAGTGLRVNAAAGHTLAAGTLAGVVTTGGLSFSGATVADIAALRRMCSYEDLE